ncbi:DsbA family protein [Radiobacillus sp. PE A8.2]|uniref:DsbA family protein n=1 Tax=Radiobacillus sp. PE A8.2 TaxID=3380349 RepID=UPI00388D42FD
MQSKSSPFRSIVIFTVIIIALIITLVVINNNKSESNGIEEIEEQPSIDGQPTLGDADAPVSVVEFGDFKCPACKAWGESIFPQLVSDYVDTGKVKFSYINVLFHGQESNLASLAAESVYKLNPDAYWEFHKALFKEQPSEDHDSSWITNEKLLEVAETIPNIDSEQLKSALNNQSELEEVNKDTTLVNAFNVKQTPTIMVNNIIIEKPFDYEAIKKAIDQALEGK